MQVSSSLTPIYIAQATHCDTESCMFPYLILRLFITHCVDNYLLYTNNYNNIVINYFTRLLLNRCNCMS